jgi:uncharacterized protein (DUF488 family)
MADPRILTVGHSNHPLSRFLELIKEAGVTTIVDVRSKPVSRWVPHFNRKRIQPVLEEQGFRYMYLGGELGGLPDDPALRKQGKPDYAAIARTAAFTAGVGRVIEAGANDVVALLCVERDPIDCHRFRLISRELAARDVDVAHILPSGQIERQADAERRAGSIPSGDLFGQRLKAVRDP